MNIVPCMVALAALLSVAASNLEGVTRSAPRAGAFQAVPSPRYKITTLGTLLQDDQTPGNNPTAYDGISEAYSINNHGQVVGDSTARSAGHHAFLWQDGRITDIGLSHPNRGSVARAINDKGQVAGSLDVEGGRHAFLWERGRMRDLGTLGGSVSSALALNNKGEVVGYSDLAPRMVSGAVGNGPLDKPWRLAMLWTERRGMTALGVFPNTFSSTATGINDNGVVVGTMVTVHPQAQPAVAWEDGKPRIIGYDYDPGGNDNQAGGINSRGQIALQQMPHSSRTPPYDQYTPSSVNDAGQVVGSFWRSSDSRGFPVSLPPEDWGPEKTDHAFVWQHGRVYDLNTCLSNGAGWLLTDARGINAKGQIVGTGFLAQDPKEPAVNRRMAYLLTPL